MSGCHSMLWQPPLLTLQLPELCDTMDTRADTLYLNRDTQQHWYPQTCSTPVTHFPQAVPGYFLAPPPGASTVAPNHWLLQSFYHLHADHTNTSDLWCHLARHGVNATAPVAAAPHQVSLQCPQPDFLLAPTSVPVFPPPYPVWEAQSAVSAVPIRAAAPPYPHHQPRPAGECPPVAHQTEPPRTASESVQTPRVTSRAPPRLAPSPESGYSSSGTPPAARSALDVFLEGFGERPPAYKKRRGGAPRVPKSCPHCPKTYQKRSALNFHLAVKHPSETPADHTASLQRSSGSCSVCHKTFNSVSALRVHMRRHTGERPYACEECGKTFGDGSVWRRHRRVHTGEKPWVCDVCGLDFSQKGNLQRHVSTQHQGVSPSPQPTSSQC